MHSEGLYTGDDVCALVLDLNVGEPAQPLEEIPIHHYKVYYDNEEKL